MTRSRTLFVLIGSLSAAFAAGTTHVVVSGDTMWDITGKYLGDPFHWPTVWQKNPQIANAHRIYPGDTIHVDGVSQGTPTDTSKPAVVASGDPLQEFPLSPELQTVVQAAPDPMATLAVSPAQSVLNPDAMKVAPVLYRSGEAPKTIESGLDWGYEGSRHMIRPGTVVGTGLGTSKGIDIGAYLEVVESNQRVLTHFDPTVEGRYEQVRAVCVVVEADADSSRCLMQRVYGDAGIHAVARPYEKPQARMVTSFEDVSEAQAARVVGNTRNSRLQLPGSYVVLDRGTDGAVSEGDIFEFMAAKEKRGLAAMRGYGIVVRTTRSTATVFVVGVRSRPILTGDQAWRVRKAVGPG